MADGTPPPVVTPPPNEGSPVSSKHSAQTHHSTVTAQSHMTVQSEQNQEDPDVFPVSENEVVQDLIRQAKDLSRPSLRRKALCELQERGLYFPDNRMGRTAMLVPPGKGRSVHETSSSSQSRSNDDRLVQKAPSPVGVRLMKPRFKAPPSCLTAVPMSPFPIAIDTPRSTSSRISWMSDSASKVSHVTDCAALWYRAMGGSVLSGQSPLSSVVSSSWVRLQGQSSVAHTGEAESLGSLSDVDEDDMAVSFAPRRKCDSVEESRIRKGRKGGDNLLREIYSRIFHRGI